MNKQNDPRENYIAIASRLFGKQGFHGTSLAALAKEAGVTKQALLHFFATKERLYGEVLSALSSRLCLDIDKERVPDKAEHLGNYLISFARSATSNPEDAQLIVRALLESDPNARVWPMKPYLDKLVDLAKAAANDPELSYDEARSWVFQIIGTIQYLAISRAAINGMYGERASKALTAHFEQFILSSVSDLTSSGK